MTSEPLRRRPRASDRSRPASGPRPLGPLSRLLSAAGGGALVAAGWRTIGGVALAIGLLLSGAYLIYRALTGRCPVSRRLARHTRQAAPAPAAQDDRQDSTSRVDESSLESFPASDPPAWTH